MRAYARLSGLLTALAFFLVSQTLCIAASGAGGENRALCEQIIRDGGFRVSRNLDEYAKSFGPKFLAEVRGLRSGQSWLDMGAGQGMAQLQYLKEGGTAVVKAIAYERPFRPKEADPALFTFMGGRFLEDIPDADIGQADLITDVFGVLSYTPRLDEALSKYLRLLKEGGAIYLFPLQVQNTIETASGVRLSFGAWLQTIPGLILENVGTAGDDSNALRITRGAANIEIPKLRLISSEDGWPPAKTFKVQTLAL